VRAQTFALLQGLPKSESITYYGHADIRENSVVTIPANRFALIDAAGFSRRL